MGDDDNNNSDNNNNNNNEENKNNKLNNDNNTNTLILESGPSLAEYEHHYDDITNNINNNIPIKLPIIYCDHTATNTSSKSIESYIQNIILPYYGNTHTNTSITGSQSTAFISESRQIIAESCNANITGKAAKDIILFTGSGTTSCVDLVIDILNLKFTSDSIVVFMS